MSPSVKSCCIKGCTEKSRRKWQVNSSVKFYCFPLSKYGASWKEDKRIKWINAVKNYVKNPKDWEPNEHTRICSAHFINNCKSENSYHPSYVPSIFPGVENVKKSIQRLQRFERSRIRQINKKISVEEPIVINNMNNSVSIDNCVQDESINLSTNIEMELDVEQVIPEVRGCHKNASTMAVSPSGLVLVSASNDNVAPGGKVYKIARGRRPITSPWQQISSEYSRNENEKEYVPRGRSSTAPTWPLQAIPFELPLGARGASVPLIVLPIPLSVLPSGQNECELTSDVKIDIRSNVDTEGHTDSSSPISTSTSLPRIPNQRPTIRGRAQNRKVNKVVTETNNDFNNESQPTVPSYPSYVNVNKLDETVTNPEIVSSGSSKQILDLFRAQAPQAPQLPPVVLSEFDSSERIPHPEDDGSSDENIIVENNSPFQQNTVVPNPGKEKNTRSREPTRPYFSQPLMIRGELTVPRADYTEMYTAWWDFETGSSRIDFYGGSTTTYRTIMADRTIQRLEMRVDRSGESAVRRCGKGSSKATTPLDTSHPVLPDINLFTFVGFETGDERVERWRHSSVGEAGGLGAAPGESLTLRHDLLLIRDGDDSATPIQYTVAVDSSVLGPNCDGYEHHYLDVREHNKDAEFFIPKISDLCDDVEVLNASKPEHFARLEPLREFIHPHRDSRYQAAIQDFKKKYNRHYLDDEEEALRTNLLMQHMRFIMSGNREGATFELGVNFLGDRLNVELEELLGVKLEQENTRAEDFPHTRSALRSQEPQLPNRFDWRPRGGVSPVRYQGSCSSCWAFAVAGAVEGALFIRTRTLVPLSEQCLVDCAQPFGGNGCGGTWPSHAYDYVQNRGLPALEDYPSYKAKVDTCAEQTVRPVTRISAHVNVTTNSVTALKVAIRHHAPTVVIVDAKAKSFVFYKKGVLYDDRCAKTRKKLNHAVLAVGWGERKGEPHFILKNSWSEAWGERGFVRVQARANTCGVLVRPSYPRLDDADVHVVRARIRPRNTHDLLSDVYD